MMKCSVNCIAGIIFLALTSLTSAQENDFPLLTGPYLGQEAPGMTPKIFAPGIVSTDDHMEMGCSWGPDGEILYFGRSETSDIGSNWAIWETRCEDIGWSNPKVVSFSGIYRDIAPFITPDGKSMIFYRMGNQKDEVRQGSWIAQKKDGEWEEPRYFADAYCLMTQDFHTFYFTTEEREETSKNIAQMMYKNGVFSAPEDLPGELNSSEREAHGYISPNGTYMLFDRIEQTFVSFRMEDGTWGPGVNLGMKLHIPCVSPDGKFIFFESNGDIYWVSASLVEDLWPNHGSSQ